MAPPPFPSVSGPQWTPDPLPLLVALPERARQRRWTVLLRLFLALPLAVVVVFIGIATFVVVFIGWFAAVFTARVPDFVRNLVTVYVRLILRLSAYQMLLTDRFPPFTTEDVPDYPRHLAVPHATRMNRAAVFFRIVLLVPVSLLNSILGFGYAVVAFFMWFVTLITGWLPAPVHDAYRAIARYQARVNAYALLLVPTYPAQLFGDDQSGAPAAESTPPMESTVVGPPGPDGGAAVPPGPAWPLFLGKGARRVLILVIVLGVPAYIGSSVLQATLRNHSGLVQQNNDLATGLNQFIVSSSQCRSAANPVTCQEGADGVLSGVLQSFVDHVQNTSAVGISQSVIVQVTADADNAEVVTAALANAGPTAADYQNVYVRMNADNVLTQLVRGQTQLKNALNANRFG